MPTTPIIVDAALNVSYCFRNTPPPTLRIDKLPPLPKDWLLQLENTCQKMNPYFEKNFFSKHVGHSSPYPLKASLSRQLSLIYYRFSGALDKQLGHLGHELNQLLVIKLTEDIQQCTAGFHNRVNDIVNSFQTPSNLDQLLYLVRKNIVQEIAARLTSRVDPSYQVHVADRVCRIAKKEGLAIEPNIQQDRHKSALPGETIRALLKKEFPKYYSAFKIPFLLAKQLRLIVSLHHYSGPQKAGYTSQVAENLGLLIKPFFPMSEIQAMHWKDFFIIESDGSDFDLRLVDINWPLIQSYFFQLLNDKNYFLFEPIATHLIEYAYYQSLFPDKRSLAIENLLIKHAINSKKYLTLIDHLLFIKDQFPCYWEKLRKNQCLINQIDDILFFLNAIQDRYSRPKKLMNKLDLIHTLLFSQDEAFILSKIIVGDQKIKPSELMAQDINHDLLLTSVRYRPDVTLAFFKTLFFADSKSADRLFKALLIKKNSEGSNLLMLAGRYHSPLLKIMLASISQPTQYDDIELVLKLFFTQDKEGWNFINLSAMYQPDALDFIFDFIDRHHSLFNVDILYRLFHQSNNEGWNLLYLLVRNQSEARVNLCLDFIAKKLNLSHHKKMLDLYLSKHHGGQLLRLAAESNNNTLNSILNFMREYIRCNDQPLAFFLQKNAKGWQCLHIAARYSPDNLKLMLQFITPYLSHFNTYTLSKLFLTKNKTQSNFLNLAVSYQPTSIPSIFEFMRQQCQFFDRPTLKQLFLQQNFDGWNFLSAAFRHPNNLQIMLDFVSDYIDKFDTQTIKEIILQKNKESYTCLHLAARFQPDSLKIILRFINQHIDLFADEFLLLLQASSKREENLLQLSLRYQPEAAASFLAFLNEQAHRFTSIHQCPLFKNFICETLTLLDNRALILDTVNKYAEILFNNMNKLNFKANSTYLVYILQELLDIYLNQYRGIEKNARRNPLLFFSFNHYSTQEKKAAALAFRHLLQENLSGQSIKNVKKAYPTLGHGRLGKLYQLANTITADHLNANYRLSN